MIALSNYTRRKTATIPAWAKAVRLVGNGIDGYPPQLPEQILHSYVVPRTPATAVGVSSL